MRDVPVRVDDVKRSEKMARCTYFSIESDIFEFDSHPWEFGILKPEFYFNSLFLPVELLAISLSGVIASAIGGGLLDSVEKIDELINAIEERPNLFFDTNSIFVPLALLNEAERGDIYRISGDAFVTFLQLSRDQDYYKYIEHPSGLPKNLYGSVEKSSSETEAFHDWINTHLEDSKTRHQEKPESERLKIIDNPPWGGGSHEQFS